MIYGDYQIIKIEIGVGPNWNEKMDIK